MERHYLLASIAVGLRNLTVVFGCSIHASYTFLLPRINLDRPICMLVMQIVLIFSTLSSFTEIDGYPPIHI